MAKKAIKPETIEALAMGETMIRAAELQGVSPQTLRRWHTARPELAEAVADYRARELGRISGKLYRAADRAVDALVAVVSDVDAPHSARVTAARSILQQVAEMGELADLRALFETIQREHEAANGPTKARRR